jgi:cell fate regulator YaaT (PSP1 superfamily)
MAEIVGVRFRKSGKIYHFDPAGMALKLGDNVVVETANGLGLGRAVIFTTTEAAGELSGPLKPVVRLAASEDIDRASRLCGKEGEALKETGRLVGTLGLPMKLISAEYNLDASHLYLFQRRRAYRLSRTGARFEPYSQSQGGAETGRAT